MKFNGRNLHISNKAVIGANVRIGDNTVIYDNVVIGDNTTICNDCIIGEPLNDYYTSSSYENPKTVIGPGSLVRSHCIIYAGNTIGGYFSTGHRVTIREKNTIGHHCSFGTLCDIQGYSSFGNYCRLHSNVHIGQQSAIGNFVFIYPYVVFTNDPHPPSNICQGPAVGDYTQIAVHSVLLPMVKIGKNCLIGANSTVNKDFGDEQVIVGSPAKATGSIRNIKSKETEGLMHYPWMYHFDRGMPWQGIGYDEWLRTEGGDIQ
jgi:UDP-3-O-[3-hydroxymyristoyl] glucosamine N-acyltransferase